jgi:outer membrane protein OmpA-like peptidoglycan-associated protein
MTLLLCLGLAVTAYAQQSSSSSSTQSAQATAGQGPLEPLPPQTPKDFWDGDNPSLGALIFHPFATKTYVKRHVEPIRDRINELEELTESNKQQIRDVDNRATHGIQLASDKASLADQHSSDATTKAQTAQQTAASVNTRVGTDETVVSNIDQYKAGAQTEIQFRAGQTMLSKQAKDALDQMAAPLKDQHGYIIEVQGFSAGHGQTAIQTSQKMADSVVRYLVLSHDIPAYRIYVIGMGNASPDQHLHGGHVDVNVLKNDLGQLAQK